MRDWEHGTLFTQAEVEALLGRLEGETRTGTLELSWQSARATLTFVEGRIRIAHSGALSRLDALDRVMTAQGASFTFQPHLVLSESSRLLNLRPSTYLRKRGMRRLPA